jgi:hypothetical protein|tara:strand:+ start:3147 stop:4310 length:1164 start_codon:yes stop_codon:yes gene_type:complete
MNRYVFFVLLLVAFSVHSNPAVDNNSSRKIGSEATSKIDRKKEIKVDNTKKKISSQTSDKLRSMDLSRRDLQSFSISEDVPLSSILTPMIRSEEVNVASTNWDDLAYIKKNGHQTMLDVCRLYSSISAVPTAFPYHIPVSGFRRPGVQKGWMVVEGGAVHQFVQDKGLSYINPEYKMSSRLFSGMSNMKHISDAMGRRLDNPAMPVRCFYYYARLGEEVIKNLSDSTIAVEKNSSKETLFIGIDLGEAVKLAFRKTMSTYNPYDIEEFANVEIDKGCRLPTLVGIQSNIVDWQCGGLSVDPNALSASLGGVPILGGNTFFGKTVTLNRVNGHDVANSLLVSERQGSSVADSTETAKGTSLTKGRSTSTGVGSGVDSASGSGVGSRGQ